MTLKKINPEDLVLGREYYVKMTLFDEDDSSVPHCFKDAEGDKLWLPTDQPIYTLEQSDTDNVRMDGKPMQSDTDLEMLVNVASRLYVADIKFTKEETENVEINTQDEEQRVTVYKKLLACEALDIITACKQALKEGER